MTPLTRVCMSLGQVLQLIIPLKLHHVTSPGLRGQTRGHSGAQLVVIVQDLLLLRVAQSSAVGFTTGGFRT